MNFFESIIISFIILLFPVFCYLFYIVADKNFDEKKRNLVFNFVLLSIFYIVNKFDSNIVYNFLILSIPLFLSYKKKFFITTNLFLVAIILLAFVKSSYYFYFLIAELLVLFIFNRKRDTKLYIFTMSIITLIYTFTFDFSNILNNIYYIIAFAFFTNLVLYTIIKGEDIIDYHIEYKDLKKENEIRRSLFKITHEIKNPLAVIKAYVDMFDYNDKECSKKYVPIISSEVDKMLLLLQDFLLVNKENINFDIMDINMLLEDITKSLYDIHKLKVELDSSEEEIFINGDYNRLTQVISNLVKNSYEANANKVIVKSYLSENNVIIEVIDNGEGISKSVYKKIYEPFFTTKKDGTGLGVPLSKEIIEAHNGTLCYINNKNSGITARIELPLYGA